MSATYVSDGGGDSGSALAAAATIPVTLTCPASVINGNALWAFVVVTPVTGLNTALTPPAGWTVRSSLSSAPNIVWILSKVASSADSGTAVTATITVTTTGTAHTWASAVLQYSNSPATKDGTSAASSGPAGSGTTATAPAISPTAANSTLITVISIPVAAATATVPTGETNRFTGTVGPSIFIEDQALTASGTTGTRASTITPAGGGGPGWHAANITIFSTTTITVTKQLVWNTQATITVTKQLVWNTRSLGPVLTKQLVWNDRVAVSVTKQLVWNTKAKIVVIKQLVWNTRAAILVTKILVWNVRLLVPTVTKKLVWNTRVSIAVTKQLVWKVFVVVNKSITLKWNDLFVVARSVTLKWGVKEPWTRVSPNTDTWTKINTDTDVWTPVANNVDIWSPM